MDKKKLETKFGETNIKYKKFRPTYPKILFEVILNKISKPYLYALDIGAGTGISTEFLSNVFEKVVVAEPNEKMISVGHFGTNVHVINDCTENVEFDENTFDLITAGNSFYWMEAETVLEQMYRWLKPKGKIAVYRYNFPLTNSDLINEIIIEETDKHWNAFKHERLIDTNYTYRHITKSSKFCNVQVQNIDNFIKMSSEEIVGFFSSTSYVSAYLKTLDNPLNYLKCLECKIKDASNLSTIKMDFGLELIIADRK